MRSRHSTTPSTLPSISACAVVHRSASHSKLNYFESSGTRAHSRGRATRRALRVCVWRDDSCTYSKWRTLKRFLARHKLPILSGNEQAIRKHIKLLGDEYEFDTSEGGVPFARLTDLPSALESFVERYARAGHLKRRLGMTTDDLRVSVLIDKGKGTTKCFVSVWDVDYSASPYHTLFVGLYHDDDSRESLESVFGPPLAQLQMIASNINWPHSYGAGANLSNTDAATAFLDHVEVKRDRSIGTNGVRLTSECRF